MSQINRHHDFSEHTLPLGCPAFTIGCETKLEKRIPYSYATILYGWEMIKSPPLNLMHLSAGASMIDLLPAPEGSSAERNVDHVALQIELFNADELMAHLRRHDFEQTLPCDHFGAAGTGPPLTFQDPDGNTIELKRPVTAP